MSHLGAGLIVLKRCRSRRHGWILDSQHCKCVDLLDRVAVSIVALRRKARSWGKKVVFRKRSYFIPQIPLPQESPTVSPSPKPSPSESLLFEPVRVSIKASIKTTRFTTHLAQSTILNKPYSLHDPRLLLSANSITPSREHWE